MAKYTDEHIKKALECCHNITRTCCECSFGENGAHCRRILAKNALDLINRQEAEIEKWKAEANRYQNLWCKSEEDIQTAKSEAIKEFAERLVTRWANIVKETKYTALQYAVAQAMVATIKDVVAEMVGEGE